MSETLIKFQMKNLSLSAKVIFRKKFDIWIKYHFLPKCISELNRFSSEICTVYNYGHTNQDPLSWHTIKGSPSSSWNRYSLSWHLYSTVVLFVLYFTEAFSTSGGVPHSRKELSYCYFFIKGCLISESIFTLIPSSQAKSLSLTLLT